MFMSVLEVVEILAPVMCFMLFFFLKVKARVENEQYSRKHPEVTVLLSSFLKYVNYPAKFNQFTND